MAAKKTIKKVVFIIVGIIIVVIIALGIFISTFDINKYKPTIEEKVSAAVGYNLRIDGELGLAIFPSISVEVKNLHLENPGKFKAQAVDFVYVEKANVGLALIPLLSKRLEFKDITLNGVNLNLVKPAEGAPNWNLNVNKKHVATVSDNTNTAPAAAEEAKSGDSHAKIVALMNSLSFNEFAVKNTNVVYYDMTADKTQTFDKIDFTCGPFNNADKPLKFSLSARMNNTPLSVKGQLTSISSILEGAVPFNVDASFSKLNAKVEGKFAAAGDPMLEATVSVPAFSPKDVVKSLMPAVPDIITKSGSNAFAKLETTQTIAMSQKKAITFAGPFIFDQTAGTVNGSFSNGVIQVKITGDKLNPGPYMPSQEMLQKLNLAELAANASLNKGLIEAAFNGNFTLEDSGGKASGTYNNKNNIHNATIKADIAQLNLDTLMVGGAKKTASAGGSSSGGAKATSSSAAKKPILDPATFNKLNVAADVKLARLIFKGLAFSNTAVNAKLNQGMADASFSAQYGGAPLSGTFGGNLTAQSSPKTLSFKSSGLPVEPMMKAFMNKDLLTGTLNSNLNLNGGGMDIDDFKRSMSGHVAATVNKGKINVGPGIPFDSIKVEMPFTNGKGDIKTGSMTGSVLSADMTGWVNLNNDTLDVTMTPIAAMPVDAIASAVGLGLPQGLTSGISAKVPFRIHGSLKSPTLDWTQSIGTILQNLDSESLKQFDPKNIEENLKQGLHNQLDEALPGTGGLLDGLFGGKNSGAKSSAAKTPADTAESTATTPSAASTAEEPKPAQPAESAAVSADGNPPVAEQPAASSRPDSLENAAKDAASQLLKGLGK